MGEARVQAEPAHVPAAARGENGAGGKAMGAGTATDAAGVQHDGAVGGCRVLRRHQPVVHHPWPPRITAVNPSAPPYKYKRPLAEPLASPLCLSPLAHVQSSRAWSAPPEADPGRREQHAICESVATATHSAWLQKSKNWRDITPRQL